MTITQLNRRTSPDWPYPDALMRMLAAAARTRTNPPASGAPAVRAR
jgi:hypothetical protein